MDFPGHYRLWTKMLRKRAGTSCPGLFRGNRGGITSRRTTPLQKTGAGIAENTGPDGSFIQNYLFGVSHTRVSAHATRTT